MKLVRRARKSLKERRMKVCLSELTSNLSKVELKVHRHLKDRREARRAARGDAPPIVIPPEVLEGRMNQELYEIECRLHREAGIPPPPPFSGRRSEAKYVGCVLFAELFATVRAKWGRKKNKKQLLRSD